MVFMLLVFSHVLADFTFQSEEIANKKGYNINAFIKHIFTVFILSLIFTSHLFSFRLLLLITIITLLHGLIDYIKILLEKRVGTYYQLELFIVDQLIHIIVLLLAVHFLKGINPSNLSLVIYFKLARYLPLLQQLNKIEVTYVLFILSVIIFNFKGSTLIVRNILKKYKTTISDNGDKGKAIGNLERLLIITFMFLEYYTLIGLIFTAKSLIRFKQIEVKEVDSDFVEYYLIGSLASIFLAVISGVFIKYVGGILLAWG